MKDLEAIEVEYAYLTIPAKYICIYHKLLMYMADFGKDIIDDCTASCKGDGKNIANCWNIFQSACAAYSLEEYKKADFYIDYIEKELNNIYKNKKRTFPTTIPIGITPDGRLKAKVSCCSGQRFYVDVETGKLYREYKEKEECTNKVYEIVDNNLIFKDNDTSN